MTRALAALAATRPGAFEVHEVHDEHDWADPERTAPVQRVVFEPPPLPPPDDDIGTRTLMGIGARAVRATATSGCVEARPATREPRATPDASYSQSMRASIGEAPAPTVEVAPLVSVQPLYRLPEELDLASTTVDAPAIDLASVDEPASALAAPPLRQPIAAPEGQADPRARSRKLPRAGTKHASMTYRVLATGAISVVAGVLAAYIATMAF